MSADSLGDNAFWVRVTSELLQCCFRREGSNIDYERYGRSWSLIKALKAPVLDIAAAGGFYRSPYTRLDFLEVNGLERAYALLEDEQSRELFIKLLAYRVLGPYRVRLPLNNREYHAQRRSMSRFIEKRKTKRGVPMFGTLDLCNVDGVRYHGLAGNVLNSFILEQYRCARAGVGVQDGDVVIDGGGGWGDTPLYFARKASRVFCFECIPANLALIQENVALNPGLADRITLVERALSNRTGETLTFVENGPGSRRASDNHGITVLTQTIDDFVQANGLDRVDLIKMDIEGSEPEALAGAERTLRTHRPQLAISIYHDVRHFGSIPGWLADLDLGYRFYLDHFTIHAEETILFARCDG